MKFRYIGDCEAGYVKFGDLVMPEGEAVEVTGLLATKLSKNPHFEAVTDEEAEEIEQPKVEQPKRRGRKPKSETGENDAG